MAEKSFTGSNLSAGLADTNGEPTEQRGERLTSANGESITFGAHDREGSKLTFFPDGAEGPEHANQIAIFKGQLERIEKESDALIDPETGETMRGQEANMAKLVTRVNNLNQGIAYEQKMAKIRAENARAEQARKNGNLAEQAAAVDNANAKNRKAHGVDAITIRRR